MKELGWFKHLFCYVTLGLLCGWYYFLLVVAPLFIYGALIHRSIICAVLLTLLTVSALVPLNHEPWEAFMYSFVFKWWREYFDMTFDNESIAGDKAFKPGQRYIFFEFPHGIFPMGQFLSSSLIRDLTPGHMICGTAADVIFKIPVMRQVMAWLGTQPANRKNISKIFARGRHAAVIPGGIAEMYVISDTAETIFFNTRRNTVKMAIQEGAHIIPLFAFGNSQLFTVPSSSSSATESFLAKLSRKMRASIVFFYGRNFLPVPYRHPLHLVTGEVVEVVQCDNPKEEQIDATMKAVIDSIKQLYELKRPSWEKRPLGNLIKKILNNGTRMLKLNSVGTEKYLNSQQKKPRSVILVKVD